MSGNCRTPQRNMGARLDRAFDDKILGTTPKHEVSKYRKGLTMSKPLDNNKAPKKEVSGIWVLVMFVVLLGAILTLATVSQ